MQKIIKYFVNNVTYTNYNWFNNVIIHKSFQMDSLEQTSQENVREK